MQRNDIDQEPEHEDLLDEKNVPVEEAEHPAPDIEHYPEPDAENIMPVEDGPGTL
ncbi:hypothetical protein BH20ACI2_BH20ACI2_20410 [soil metagenome]